MSVNIGLQLVGKYSEPRSHKALIVIRSLKPKPVQYWVAAQCSGMLSKLPLFSPNDGS